MKEWRERNKKERKSVVVWDYKFITYKWLSEQSHKVDLWSVEDVRQENESLRESERDTGEAAKEDQAAF